MYGMALLIKSKESQCFFDQTMVFIKCSDKAEHFLIEKKGEHDPFLKSIFNIDLLIEFT